MASADVMLALLPRPKKLTLKSYKRYWTTFKDTHLMFYRSREEASGPSIMKINVRGKYVTWGGCRVNTLGVWGKYPGVWGKYPGGCGVNTLGGCGVSTQGGCGVSTYVGAG